MQKILIVIDMQNDFVTGSLGSEAAQVLRRTLLRTSMNMTR